MEATKQSRAPQIPDLKNRATTATATLAGPHRREQLGDLLRPATSLFMAVVGSRTAGIVVVILPRWWGPDSLHIDPTS